MILILHFRCLNEGKEVTLEPFTELTLLINITEHGQGLHKTYIWPLAFNIVIFFILGIKHIYDLILNYSNYHNENSGGLKFYSEREVNSVVTEVKYHRSTGVWNQKQCRQKY